ANVSIEKEVMTRTAINVSYVFVGARHLIRARDGNLPQPVVENYPVFDETGSAFTGEFLPITSFSHWRFVASLTCPFPPCIDPLQRPIASLGAIDLFESAAASTYHGFTLSARRRMTSGVYFHLAYTLAKAEDSLQDALLTGSSQVQNTFDTK